MAFPDMVLSLDGGKPQAGRTLTVLAQAEALLLEGWAA